MVRIFNGKGDGEIVVVSSNGGSRVCGLGPLFKFAVKKEIRIRLLVEPLTLSELHFALFKNFAFAATSGIGATVPGTTVNVIEEFGKARRVVVGEVFNYV
jgi:hypothetical protein